jgi:hypothetical protein
LSAQQTFQVDSVECWLLKPPEEEDGGGAGASNNKKGSSSSLAKNGGGSTSVLKQGKEDKKILEWAGVGKEYSAGVRDEPLEED